MTIEIPHTAFIASADARQVIWWFPNGYGASMISDRGPEIAVLIPSVTHKCGYDLVYDTPVTADVRPVPTYEDLVAVLNEVRDLPARAWCQYANGPEVTS
jgi:hypothetical protein